MSGITKVDKSNLDTSISSIESKVKSIDNEISTLNGTLSSIPSHEDFSALSSKSSLISNSFSNLKLDLNHVSKNMRTYLEVLKEIDGEGFELPASKPSSAPVDTYYSSTPTATKWSTVSGLTGTVANLTPSDPNYTYSYTVSPSGTVINTDFPSGKLTDEDYNVSPNGKYNYEEIEKYLDTVNGIAVAVPAGLGAVNTYMGWQMITAQSSTQYKLREAAGMNFDEEGFGKIGDRYVVATTTTFGNVGDYIDVYLEDGTVLKCVIGDIKNQNDEGCNKWGHLNGQCIIEFVVDKNTWYKNDAGSHVNPGTENCHPEWHQCIDKIVNKGNFFELIKKDAAQLGQVKFDSEEAAAVNFVEIASNQLTDDKVNDYAQKFVDANASEETWSCEFVSYCAKEGGYVANGALPSYSSTEEGILWFNENTKFETSPDYSPHEGDIVFYDNDGDGHADYSAIIISTGVGTFTTVEGNFSEKVQKNTYSTNDSKIVGYGLPDYAMLLLKDEDDEEGVLV